MTTRILRSLRNGFASVAVIVSAMIVFAPLPGLHAEVSDSISAKFKEQTNPEVIRLKKLALDHWIGRSNRLQQIAQRIQIAGMEICGKTDSPIFGAAILDIENLTESLQETARDRFGSKHRYYVTGVFDNLPAAQSGLQIGDAVVTVNGSSLQAEKGFYGFRPTGNEVHRIGIVRSGEGRSIEIETVVGCRFPASVDFTDVANAHAYGDHIDMSAGFMRAFGDDSILAQVLGHEVAHNVFQRQRGHTGVGWASRRSEARADYVGLYLAAIAGYPLVNRYDENPMINLQLGWFSKGGTHPTDPSRKLATEKTIAEIQEKRRRGEKLRLRFE